MKNMWRSVPPPERLLSPLNTTEEISKRVNGYKTKFLIFHLKHLVCSLPSNSKFTELEKTSRRNYLMAPLKGYLNLSVQVR